MESQREITKKYNELIKSVENDEFYKTDLYNKVNCYVCEKCGHVTKTIDVDAGVTPFMHTCEKCGETAQSTFYEDIRPNQEPTQEWFRPNLKQVLKLRTNFGLLDHILSGGLDVRNIDKVL